MRESAEEDQRREETLERSKEGDLRDQPTSSSILPSVKLISPMYRMYVDEVGHADLRASQDPKQRYLSLTGVIFDLEYHDSRVTPLLERLKARHFPPRADGLPLIFHRKELVNGNYPFDALKDPEKKAEFDGHLLWLIENLDYVVISTTIDKLEHLNRYTVWHHHPYHYCQEVLLERYVMWLNRRSEKGDVYAESRGKREDFLLKKAFRFIYNNGTTHMKRSDFQTRLSQNDVKLYRKAANLAGLQLADLIAHPSFKVMLAKRNKQAIPDNFGGKIGRILEESKYDRSRTGQIEGFGRKWLP